VDPFEIAEQLILSELRAGNALPTARQKALALVRNAEAVDRAARKVAADLRIIDDLDPAPIAEDTRDSWYVGPRTGDKYWPAYRGRLLEFDWDETMIGALDRTSSRVTGLLDAPGNPTISTRGLVIGHVQSGKTANFTGVIAKAADCNYRFFIVLAGVTNSLRLQTQKRLERDLTSASPGAWSWLTRKEIFGDFGDHPAGNIDVALQNTQVRTIAVVKKNSAVLRKLNDWIAGGNEQLKQNCPVLLIDDEADHASVPTSKRLEDDELSAINRRIVTMLGLLPKIAYVGYTATPFANVLIDPKYDQNLYPRSFIISLPTPNDYFGAERIFGRDRIVDAEDPTVSDGLPLVRTVPDDELPQLRPSSNAAARGFEFSVTASLDEALRYFYMATAARLFREKAEGIELDFSTMLIHTSPRIRVHASTEGAVAKHRQDCLARSESDRGDWKSLWERELASLDRDKLGQELEEVSFEDLAPYLRGAIERCEIIVSNSDPNKEVNVSFEKKGQIAIVIGGNTLSRGLTLEGLVVSFFVRTSSAYDTILQMGRWFGYRRGYEDLPRVWMTEDMEDNFFDLATIEQEFRSELSRYQFGKTPAEVAPRIRRHPKMRITAANKMRWSTDCQTSYGGQRTQTIYFKRKDRQWLIDNITATSALLDPLGGPSATKRGRLLWKDVPVEPVMTFLGDYRFHERSRDMNADLIREYIAQQNGLGGMLRWNIVLMGRGTPDPDLKTISIGRQKDIALLNRSRLKLGSEETANIKALMSTPDVLADRFDQDAGGDEIDRLFARREELEPSAPGLLLIYPISRMSKPAGPQQKERTALDTPEDVIGVAIVFPAPRGLTGSQNYVSAQVVPVVTDDQEEVEDDTV
jgi:hypothetical protein